MPKKDEPKANTARLLQESDFRRLPWRSVGPASMGGRVSDLAFVPGDPKSFFVGYATGGVWKTDNRGTTFTPIFDGEETSCIGSIGIARLKSKGGKKQDDVIWLGTGEGNGRNSSSWGNGVYRSTDGGSTWEHCGLESTHEIPSLAVDPRDPDVCYVAALGHLWGENAERGLYKTTDGGKSWSKVMEIDQRTGCCHVALDPSDPDTVYAAFYDRMRTPYSFRSGGPKGGLYKSKDAGKSWKKLTKGLPSQTGRIGLDIFPGDTKKLVAVVESTEGGANSIRDDRMRGGGVFRSDDGGESWRRCSVRSPRAFYFSKIKFDPKDDQRVYMLGWTVEWSDDGGETFVSGAGNILHADLHAMLIDPNDTAHLIIGTDGGVYQSFDKGKTWDFLNTMATGQFYNISLDSSDPYRIIGGLQDNGTWLGPSATNRLQEKMESAGIPDTSIVNSDWQDVFWGDGFHAEFDPTDRDTVYAEWQGGHVTRLGLQTGEKRYLSPEAREGEPRFRYNWNTPFFVSPHDPTVLYHAGNCVFRLTQRGDMWERISPDLTTCDPAKMDTVGSNAETHCTIVSLCESPMKAGLLWAGSDDGLVHVSKDGGKSWTNVTPKSVDGRYISRLHASGFVEGRCYMAVDGHRTDDMRPCILATDDYGTNWKDIAAGLPSGRTVHVVREHPDAQNVLMCGTENAVHLSFDSGKTWIKAHGKRLPTVPVYDLKVHPREKDLVIGTHGRSIWILDDASWLAEMSPEVASSALHLFATGPARPRWFTEVSGLWTHKVFRAENPPMGAVFQYWVAEYTGDEVEIVVEDSKGRLMKKLSGGSAAGYHRVVWNCEPDEWLKLSDKDEDRFSKFFVRPGTYNVKVSMGKHKCKGSFEVQRQ